MLKTAAHKAALCAKEGLVRGSRNQVGPFDKGLLEVGTDEPQHMSHVVHQHSIDLLGIKELADLGHRFLVQDHAFAENDQLGPVRIDEFQRGRHINHVRIVGQDREIDHGRALRTGVSGHKIL